jgi:hypothetical protein
MTISADWEEHAWGSAILTRQQRDGALDVTPTRVLDEIRVRARNIGCSHPDRDVQALADAVLILSAMLRPLPEEGT